MRRYTLFLMISILILPLAAELQIVTIRSTPEGAAIFLDDNHIGTTDKQLLLEPGSYKLYVVLEHHQPVTETITVSDKGENIFNFTLPNLTGTLKITTDPPDARVYLNGIRVYQNELVLDQGSYTIEVKRDGYEPATEEIKVIREQEANRTVTLKRDSGSLLFVIEPMEARVALTQGEAFNETWTGGIRKDGLPVGKYQISATLTGYKPATDIIEIQKDETTVVSFKLEAAGHETSGSDIPNNAVFSFSGPLVFQSGFRYGLQLIRTPKSSNPRMIFQDYYVSWMEDGETETFAYDRSSALVTIKPRRNANAAINVILWGIKPSGEESQVFVSPSNRSLKIPISDLFRDIVRKTKFFDIPDPERIKLLIVPLNKGEGMKDLLRKNKVTIHSKNAYILWDTSREPAPPPALEKEFYLEVSLQ